MTTIGHNSGSLEDFIDKLENLELQRVGIVTDMQELYKAAKEKGLKPKAMKAIIREKMMTQEQKERRSEAERTVAEYKHQLALL